MGLYQAGPEPSGSVLGGLASSDTQIEKPSVEVLCWEEGVPVSNSYKFILEVRCGSEAPPGIPTGPGTLFECITKKQFLTWDKNSGQGYEK